MTERKIELIRTMSVEEFYSLDNVTIETEGFFYGDKEYDISEMVSIPEEAFIPEDKWGDEDYSDHLHPAYIPSWKELQQKVVEAYGNY